MQRYFQKLLIPLTPDKVVYTVKVIEMPYYRQILIICLLKQFPFTVVPDVPNSDLTKARMLILHLV